MAKRKHLTLNDRIRIQSMLNERASFKQIGAALEKDPTTISKEIRSHLLTHRAGGFHLSYNSCKLRFSCTRSHLCSPCHARRKYSLCKRCSMCNTFCPDFQREICDKLLKPPYVCNGCSSRMTCSLEKRLYKAQEAHQAYRCLLSDSRSGISFSEEEIRFFDEIITPLIRKNQSPHAICAANRDRLMVSERTIYRLIDSRLISATNLDLPRKVRYRARKKKNTLKVDKACRVNRTYDCFEAFLQENPNTPVVQLDTVEGRKGGKVLLTIHFVKAEFMLAFLRDRNDSKSVIDIFNHLYVLLGHNSFSQIFPLCLTDNGSEFSNPKALELYDDVQRTRVFYCNPRAPYQKGSAERNHEFIRCFLPKGTSFDDLSQANVDLMMDHINSYCRKSLGDKAPYDMMAFLYGAELLESLGCHRIPPQDVTLKRSVFSREVPDDLR